MRLIITCSSTRGNKYCHCKVFVLPTRQYGVAGAPEMLFISSSSTRGGASSCRCATFYKRSWARIGSGRELIAPSGAAAITCIVIAAVAKGIRRIEAIAAPMRLFTTGSCRAFRASSATAASGGSISRGRGASTPGGGAGPLCRARGPKATRSSTLISAT